MSKTIGMALKENRLALGYSKKQMAQGIMSANNYARIESDEQSITVDRLIELLSYHKIDIGNFIVEVEDTYKVCPSNSILSQSKLYLKFTKAFYRNDINKVRLYRDELISLNAPEWLQLKIIVATAYMEDKISELSPTIKRRVNHELMKNIDISWTESIAALKLFGNTMSLFDIETVDYRLREVLKTYPQISELPLSLQKNLSGLYLNYCQFCYDKRHLTYINDIAIQIYSTATVPEMFMYRYIFEYYKAVFNKKRDVAKQLQSSITNCGYERYLKNIPVLPNM